MAGHIQRVAPGKRLSIKYRHIQISGLKDIDVAYSSKEAVKVQFQVQFHDRTGDGTRISQRE